MSRKIRIFDTTLRDGEQSPGCSMNANEKMEMALQLEKLGVDVIEAGFAIASPGDLKSIQAIAEKVRDSAVCSLARAVEKDIDAAWEGVRKAASPYIHLFLATSPVHMQYKLRMSPEQVLERTTAMVAYAKKYCPEIEFSAEDAGRSELPFLASVVDAAIRAGATVINIPDTVGYLSPMEITERLTWLREHVPALDGVVLSVHNHNDLGQAVANSLAAVKAGATQVECTVNGIGERAGNAALEEIVMGIHTRTGFYDAETRINTRQIYRTSRLLQSITGVAVPPNKAVVGGNAFAHESGIHQHGVLAERTTYEIMTPESIGVPENLMVLGKHSGRHAFENRMEYLGYKLTSEQLNEAFNRFKELADKKKVVTDRDLEALVGHGQTEEAGLYRLQSFVINSGNTISATARIELARENETVEGVALGSGPVDAAFKAINSIVGREIALEDYSLHSVTEGEDALGEAVVKLREGDEIITGRGVSTDIIEASIKAYVAGVNRLFMMQE